MGEKDIARIRQERLFQELVAQRMRFALTLSAAILAIYFGFIAVIAFTPAVLGTPLGGSVITLGIPVGLAVIVSAFALTGIYVQRANKHFDILTQEIKERLR
ncbi:DUF485 domain-containing protein [Taklimakanibacter deserti]|uniref:DUF485 domain-containing protein n=1 Tax=Taklimakanibacter deserti TaxID=2267839 RepID=UPI000E64DECC